jgi:hypothetical protein
MALFLTGRRSRAVRSDAELRRTLEPSIRTMKGISVAPNSAPSRNSTREPRGAVGLIETGLDTVVARCQIALERCAPVLAKAVIVGLRTQPIDWSMMSSLT